jgi:hypothetical protein
MSSDEKKELPPQTRNLKGQDRVSLVIPGLGGFGSRFRRGKDIEYKPVPSNYQSLKNTHPWQVLLKFGPPAPSVTYGLEIHSDIILGRGATGPQAVDVDLANLDAVKLGVSRRHALIRPTSRKLFLIDLDSTNGSYVNAIALNKGMAQVLRSGDTVALAGLNFEIEVVKTPAEESLSQIGEPVRRGSDPLLSGLDLEEKPIPHPLENLPVKPSVGEATLIMKLPRPGEIERNQKAEKDRKEAGPGEQGDKAVNREE